jgi:uncharacterized LabA/DUF88 family protein
MAPGLEWARAFFCSVSDPALSSSKRCVALIDGFNLFHAIDDCPHFHEYKWYDPIRLAETYLKKGDEKLIATFFFTAVPTWNDRKRVRHQKLMEIYEDRGVLVRKGMFKPARKECRLCGKVYDTFEEKQTDINICLEMFRMARDDIADRIILVTGDNDQAASVKQFLELYPEREVMVVTPPFRKANELENAATRGLKREITQLQLQKSLLPNPYSFKAGTRTYSKPEHWVNGPPPSSAGWQPRAQWVHRCH